MIININVDFTEEARRMMNARGITTEKVLQALDSARTNGSAKEDPLTGIYSAHSRVGSYIYWVRYSRPFPERYLVTSISCQQISDSVPDCEGSRGLVL